MALIVGGAVASWLVLSSLDQIVRVWALDGDIVFLGKTLYSHKASLHLGVEMGTGECNAGWWFCDE